MLLQLDRFTAEYIDGISEIAERYDAFLLDIWGVLHDSVNPYPGVIDCLGHLKAQNKFIVLVSNAARRSAVLEKELVRFGITHEIYDKVATSGELLWQAFHFKQDAFLNNLGSRFYLLGAKSYKLTEGLPLQQTENLESADFVLTISVTGNTSSTKDKEGVLQKAAELGLPMVCGNPDLKVVRNGVMGIAPGALAFRYQELGGEVAYYGKPHKAIYDYSLGLLQGIPRNRTVCVGDALKTDIAGASTANLDSILIGTGLHAEAIASLPEDSAKLQAICRQEKQFPTLVTKGFTW